MANKNWKPGEQADRDLDLFVVDSSGKHIGEISVPKGSRIPPTRADGAESYIEK